MNPHEHIQSPSPGSPGHESSELSLQPAEQVTLRHLLSDISNKVDDERHVRLGLTAGLRTLEDDPRDMGLTLIPIKSNSSVPVLRAIVDIGKKIMTDEGWRGDWLNTKYRITLNQTEELQITKHTQIINPYTYKVKEDDSPEIEAEKTAGYVEWLNSLEEGMATQDELGLSFVSEQETRNLLLEIERAYPNPFLPRS